MFKILIFFIFSLEALSFTRRARECLTALFLLASPAAEPEVRNPMENGENFVHEGRNHLESVTQEPRSGEGRFTRFQNDLEYALHEIQSFRSGLMTLKDNKVRPLIETLNRIIEILKNDQPSEKLRIQVDHLRDHAKLLEPRLSFLKAFQKLMAFLDEVLAQIEALRDLNRSSRRPKEQIEEKYKR